MDKAAITGQWTSTPSGRSGSAFPFYAISLAGSAYDPATVEIICGGTQ
ncbi:hypothetical protein LRP30_19555 [Bradyrhizobium sp. C-145]|nr:hypothetical protein [Bradyrhizobium sp. C-145]UQR67320.1 hypothetical protein LRP30_19555 [Bradyrhizobium sp. C-145]